jgi:hypothetical protein
MRLPNGPFGTAEMLEPVRRFPLPALFAVLATLVNWKVINDWGVFEAPRVPDKGQFVLTVYLATAFLWSWAAALWAETWAERRSGLLVGIAGALFLALLLRADLALLQWLSNALGDRMPATISHLFLLGAIALTPSLAPFLFRRISQSAFWQYNHTWLVGLLAAWVGSLLAFAGIVTILAATALVFENIVSDWISNPVWLLCTTLVLPWIWLALSPYDFREEAKTGAAQEFTSRVVGLLVIYILVPVTLVLSGLLVAYVVKVVAEGSTLTARLGLTSAVYGTGVIVVGLLAYPQRADTPLVRLFWRIRPFLLIAPTVLLFPALWVRVAEYGWTPERYFALIVGLWMVGVLLIGLAGSRSREEDMRIVPGLAALLLAVGAFGPWGVGDVSARSQFARLEALLSAKGALIDGRWRATSQNPVHWGRISQTITGAIFVVGADDSMIAQSAVDTLSWAGRLDWLRPWFEGDPNNPFDSKQVPAVSAEAVKRAMGLSHKYVGLNAPARLISFSASSPLSIDLPGESGSLVGPISVSSLPVPLSFSTPRGEAVLVLDGRNLHLELSGMQIATFDLTGTLETLKAQPQPLPTVTGPRRPVIMLEGTGLSRARLAITMLSGDGSQAQPTVSQLTAYVLIPAQQ